MIKGAFDTPVHYRVPQLFRYTDKKFINDFFTSGKIRLGSLQKYRHDIHSERGDNEEGKRNAVAILNPGTGSIYAELELANNAYILCASTICSNQLQDDFQVDGVFVIADPFAFSDQIARCIPGVQQILFGECNYNDQVKRYFPELSFEGLRDLSEKDREQSSKQIFARTQSIEPYFLKASKYKSQSEYRFVFITDRIADNHIDIVCPSAVRYCMKINLS